MDNPLPMLRPIADIYVFKTPFEDAGAFAERARRAVEMLEDYGQSSGLGLSRETQEDERGRVRHYSDASGYLTITVSEQIDVADIAYLPALLLRYTLDDARLDTSAIEAFLEDNIKFIFNVFFHDFFIDYDSRFSLNDISKGKKIDYTVLAKLDASDPRSRTNKDILDSLMYLYYQLLKNAYDIESNMETLRDLSARDTTGYIASEAELFAARGDTTRGRLLAQALRIRQQIDTYVHLIS